MKDLLDPEELENLTGYKLPNKQAEILDAHQIFYIRRRGGKIRTTWYHVNHPGGRERSEGAGPNWSAL